MAELAPETPGAPKRLASLFGNVELVIVILLGIVSVTTAYASFQAALYDSSMAGNYSKGQAAQTEAESLYLEANQQYVQDVQTWARLTELSIDMESSYAETAAAANAKFDTLYFVSVGEDLDAAIIWSQEQNDADPDTYTSPFDSDDYEAALFGAWAEIDDESAALLAQGDAANSFSDRLTLNTVLMAITLFLLGVAAVLAQRRMQYVLIAVGGAIYVLALGLTLAIPFISL